MSGPVASFHLVRHPWRRAPVAWAHVVVDRWLLRPGRTPGLRLAKVLGTGRGRSTAGGADVRRWALFALWDDEADLDRFLATSPVVRPWRHAEATCTLRLRAAEGHGTWSGVDVAAAVAPGTSPAPGTPVAVLTRAWVRPPRWRRFARAGHHVDAALASAEGLLHVVGVGEAPLGLLGTVSLWRDGAAVDAFARHDPTHVEVVGRTHRERWYGESLFVRFTHVEVHGTWPR